MIRRSPRRKFYVQVDNDTIRDDRLSWKARGLLTYLLSMPDDWTARATDLANRGPDGEHAVRAGLTELEDTHYLVRERVRQEDGTFQWFSTVHERPVCPDSGFPPVDEPHVENGQVSKNQEAEPKKKEPSRARNEHFEALVAVFGNATTRSRAGHYAKTAKEIKDAGGTPEQIVERGRVLLGKGWTDAGPGALVKHWDALTKYHRVDPRGLNADRA